MAGYSKEFLVDAFLDRYKDVVDTSEGRYVKMINDQYDRQGKDAFRVSASLDAEAIKVFKAKTGRKG